MIGRGARGEGRAEISDLESRDGMFRKLPAQQFSNFVTESLREGTASRELPKGSSVCKPC